LRGATSAADELVRKAELCVDVISEARRLVASKAYGSPLGQLLVQAHAPLDDIDECALRLDHHTDRAVFMQLEGLRQGVAELGAHRAASLGGTATDN